MFIRSHQARNHARQAGFTLVELVVVIVILGVLAAVALPKFLSVSSEARSAMVSEFAGQARSVINATPSASALKGATNGLSSTSFGCWKVMNWNSTTPVLVGGTVPNSCTNGTPLFLHVFYVPQLIGVTSKPIISYHLGTTTPNYTSGGNSEDGRWTLTFSGNNFVSMALSSAPNPATCAFNISADASYSANPTVSQVTSGC